MVWSWGDVFYIIIGHKFFKIWVSEAGGIINHSMVELAMFHKIWCNFPFVALKVTTFKDVHPNNWSMHLQWSETFSPHRVRHSPNEYETVVSVGAMWPLWEFCSSINSLNCFEHRFQCFYQFLTTTDNFGLVPSSYTHLDECHGVVNFLLPGSGMMTCCPQKRQPSCTVILSLYVKYGWMVSWPALSGHPDRTKVNTLDIIESQ